MEAPILKEDDLQLVYNWVDEIPLSRPKKNITRDFSDGVLMAEIVKHFIPKIVELHNYNQSHSLNEKLYNWNTLNQKVFKKMGFSINKNDIDQIVRCQPDVIERVLKLVQGKILAYKNRLSPQNSEENIGYVMNSERQEHQLNLRNSIDPNLLYEKDKEAEELKNSIEIMELKIKKLEQLIQLKDNKIETLTNKLAKAGIR